MRLLIALTLAFVVAGAGVARADDCEFEGAHGSSRSPVTLAGGTGVVLEDSFADDGSLDAEFDEWFLPRAGAVTRLHVGTKATPLSPSLVRGDSAVMWQNGAIVAQHRGVLVGGVAFPGYHGVAAGGSADGTITLLYYAGGDAVLQRVAADGTVGAPIAVASVDRDAFLPQLTVDAHGTAFGAFHGAVLIWPANGTPQLLSGPAAPGPLVADQQGGVWAWVADGSLADITAAGRQVVHLPAGTDPVVDAQGDAVIAWSDRGRTHVARVTPDGVVEADSVLRSDDVQAVALGPGDAPWILAHIGRVLVLQGPGRTLVLRGRRGYSQDSASLAIDASGRAWVLWDEESNQLDDECHLFPAHARVRWATFGLHARHVTSHVLAGAYLPDHGDL